MERTFFNTPLPNGRFFRIIFSFEPPREEDDAPSPKKKEHQCAMIDDTEGTTKENARKKRFFLRFRAAYDRGESWTKRVSKTSFIIKHYFFYSQEEQKTFQKL